MCIVIAAFIGTFRNTLESVQTQLSLKTGNFTARKVQGHDFLDKSSGIDNGKGSSRGVPVHHVLFVQFFHPLQHAVEFVRKFGASYNVFVAVDAAAVVADVVVAVALGLLRYESG